MDGPLPINAAFGVRLVNGMTGRSRALDKIDAWAPPRSLETARELLDEIGHTMFEVFAKNVVTKIYLDRDEYLEHYKTVPKEVAQEKLIEVQEMVDAFLDHISMAYGIDRSGMTYKVATRHGANAEGKVKLSFRPYISGIKIKYTDIPALIKATGQGGFWDLHPYGKTQQLLAAINGTKGRVKVSDVYVQDMRVLRTENPDGDEDLADYIAQVVEGSWPLIMPMQEEVNKKVARPAKEDIKVSSHADECLDKEFVAGLLDCLSMQRVEDMGSWRAVGFALKLVSRGDPRFLDLFKAFSRRSEKYRTQAHQDSCEMLWDRGAADAGDGEKPLVTMGTLCAWAKEDDPVKYAAACSKRKKLTTKTVSATKEHDAVVPDVMETARKLHEITELPSSIIAIKESKLSDNILRVRALLEDGSESRLSINCETLYMTAELTSADGETIADFARFLNHNQKTALGVAGVDLSCVHKDLRADQQWIVARPTQTRAVFSTSGDDSQNATIELLNINTPANTCAKLEYRDSRKAIAIKKGDLSVLHSAYQGAIQEALKGTLRMGWVIDQINIINNGQVNINIGGQGKQQQQDKHTDDMVATHLADGNPDLQARIKFVPDAKTNNCNGLFYCNPDTCIWGQEHNIVIEEILLERCRQKPMTDILNDADYRHLESRRGRDDLRHCFAGKIIDKTLRDRLDENLDIFAFSNGCWDLTGKATFRPLKPEDCVSKTTGWAYSADDGQRHRAAVERFLEQVLPIPEERLIVLSFFASLLSGRRRAKKFLAFTDRRSGNNGKSTLLDLFRSFFGDEYADVNTKFVCRGSFERDRDSHDAGTEPFQGKRLVVAEELKRHMKLDDAMLKRLTGGSEIYVSGRRCGNGSRYRFTWQAGFVLIFNEGDCPQFDAGDAAFMERMIVAPMRSKFVANAADYDEPWTYEVDYDVKGKFPLWHSALADILVEHIGSPSVFQNLPEDMREWKVGVTSEANPLAAWIDANVIITGDDNDFIQFTREISRLCSSVVPMNDVTRLVKAYLAARGVAFKERFNNKIRNAAVGCRWVEGGPRSANEML